MSHAPADFFARVRGTLAGRTAGTHGDPRPRASGESLKPAAVLAPLVEGEHGPTVVLVRRSDRLGQHAGQIAFPGGRLEPGEGELEAALREAREEIALPHDAVELLGRLDTYETISGYRVTPFVARLSRWPLPLVPDPAEVAEILALPLAGFLAEGALRVVEREVEEEGRTLRRPINFFVVGDEIVWGATAAMLRQLLEWTEGRTLPASGDVPWERVRF